MKKFVDTLIERIESDTEFKAYLESELAKTDDLVEYAKILDSLNATITRLNEYAITLRVAKLGMRGLL